MCKLEFIDVNGSFRMENADRFGGLYFPLASELGLKSAVSPTLAGDAKTDQNHFLLEPVSILDLKDSRSSRNFWCVLTDGQAWSATGQSAWQQALKFTPEEEHTTLEAGYMWQKLTRDASKIPLRSTIRSFIPYGKNVEIHRIRVENTGEQELSFTPVTAVPIYARSADNIRDHRHVTSLLNRIYTTEYGVHVAPAMSFDERGHQKG
ncbi:MAG: cellobiose phosphorylase, partial [Blautia sp.]|nr:cellobiose phosphorylase [Blautia sp.]